MIFGSNSVASSALGSVLDVAVTTIDEQITRPFMLEIEGLDRRDDWKVETLSITDTIGEQVEAEFVLLNPANVPVAGQLVRILYYAQVLFAGTIDRVQQSSTTDLAVKEYTCTCTDFSQALIRRKLRRNFTNLPVENILDSILDNEMAGEGFAIGTIDRGTTIPLLDVKNSRILEIMRTLAGITGQTLIIGFDKSLSFVVNTLSPAPADLTYANVEESSLTTDRESYRNVQTVIVTGTPGEDEEAREIVVTRQNDSQIAARQAIEGGSGRYEEIEEITHPTSNAIETLTLMGIGYCNLRLAITGTPRSTLSARVRGYGWRAGQTVSVDLPHLMGPGSWLVQKVDLAEQGKQYLLFNLECTQSSVQRRAFESWLRILEQGKIAVQMPGAVTSNLQVFDVPGSDSFVVPANTYILEVTIIGASGGGGGCAEMTHDIPVGMLTPPTSSPFYASGGTGGNGGRAITIIAVTPGQTVSLQIGAAGAGGTKMTNFTSRDIAIGTTIVSQGFTGGDAGLSYASYLGTIQVQANGGSGGQGGYLNINRRDIFDYWITQFTGPNGAPGSGVGDAVTVGGGKLGAAGGVPFTDGSEGQDARIEIRW